MTDAFPFFSTLYTSIPGRITVQTYSPRTPSSPSRPVDAVHAATIDEAIDEAARGVPRGDVYFGVATRSPDVERHRSGTKGQLIALPALWLDVDVGNAGHKAAIVRPPHLEAALDVLASALPPWSAMVSSGGGAHLYWKLDSPILLGTPGGIARAERALAWIDSLARAAFAPHGWNLDDTTAITRILRVPGTINYKPELATPSPPSVVLVALTGHTFDLQAAPAGTSVPAVGTSGGSPSTPAGATCRPSAVADTPDRFAAIRKPAVPIAEVRERLGKIRRPESRDLFTKILAGEPAAKIHGRELEIRTSTATVGALFPWNDPDELADQIFGATLDAHAAENPGDPGPDRFETSNKIARMQDKQRTQLLDGQTLVDELANEARKKGDGGALPLDGAPRGKYTLDEIDEFAALHKTTRSGLRRRWVLSCEGSYYILANGRYLAPVGERGLAVHLDRDLAPAPVSWDRYTKDGGTTRKSVSEFLLDYSTGTRKVVADLTIRESTYDVDADTFYEAVCPVRALPSEFDPDVDQWIRTMGGANAEKLLDWVASVTRLDAQCCALYLSGVPGIGKGLLARGLAQLWTERGNYTPLSSVLDAFNADIANCPLIFADEKIDQGWQRKLTSATLRELIGSSVRRLSRKYLPNTDLVGSIRLLLAANNDRMLELGESEDYSKDDLDAVAGRFLHITIGKNVVEHVERLKRDGVIARWLANSTIARHALWLRTNRIVTPGRRFIVEGHLDEMIDRVSTQTRAANLVLEWLTLYLSAPIPNPAQAQLIEAGGGVLAVSPTVFAEWWDRYIKHDKVPGTRQISRVLSNWATKKTRIGNTRALEVPVEKVLRWAEDNNVGSHDEIRRRVDGPIGNLADAGVVTFRGNNGVAHHESRSAADVDEWEAQPKGDA